MTETPTTIWDLFGQPAWARRMEETLNQIGAVVPTITEALQAWTDYAGGLKQQLSDAEAALTDAQNTIQTLKDTDAAEDAAQAAALQDQAAQQISDALAAVQNPPEPPADATPPADAGTVETPPADATPPADTSSTETPPADTPPADTTAPADSGAPPWAPA